MPGCREERVRGATGGVSSARPPAAGPVAGATSEGEGHMRLTRLEFFKYFYGLIAASAVYAFARTVGKGRVR
ncbi:MAG: hypothetical protein Kow00122_02550 [Thermoleophilia bacterium]